VRSCQSLDAGQGQNQNLQKDSLFVSTPVRDLGMVVVGSSKTLTNSISNPVASSIAITRATVDKADFRISGPSLRLTIVPGQGAPPQHYFHSRYARKLQAHGFTQCP
jgi:hypothetical protein